MWVSLKPMKLCVKCLLFEPQFHHISLKHATKYLGIQRSTLTKYPILQGYGLLRTSTTIDRVLILEMVEKIILWQTLVSLTSVSEFLQERELDDNKVWLEVNSDKFGLSGTSCFPGCVQM
jgi:hypothetical protein